MNEIFRELGQFKTETDMTALVMSSKHMSRRLANRLIEMNIKSLEQASEFSRKSFLVVRNCGVNTVNKLELCLAEKGLSFAPDMRRQPEKNDSSFVPIKHKGLGTVYFIKAADCVKIGYTCKGGEYSRLKCLQTSNHEKLEILAIIPDSLFSFEGELHKKFAHLRIRGEWFKLNREVRDFINAKAVIV